MTGPDLSLTAVLIKFFIYPGELAQHIFLTSEGFHHFKTGNIFFDYTVEDTKGSLLFQKVDSTSPGQKPG